MAATPNEQTNVLVPRAHAAGLPGRQASMHRRQGQPRLPTEHLTQLPVKQQVHVPAAPMCGHLPGAGTSQRNRTAPTKRADPAAGNAPTPDTAAAPCTLHNTRHHTHAWPRPAQPDRPPCAHLPSVWCIGHSTHASKPLYSPGNLYAIRTTITQGSAREWQLAWDGVLQNTTGRGLGAWYGGYMGWQDLVRPAACCRLQSLHADKQTWSSLQALHM